MAYHLGMKRNAAGISPDAADGLAAADDVAALFAAVDHTMDVSPDTARLIVRTLRRLAEGRPLIRADIDALADDLAQGEAAASFVNQMSERDDAGAIVGLFGLSLNDHPHAFAVGGRRLHTWCAWDTLFLPALLGTSAEVVSRDPASGDEIRLTVGPKGIEKASREDVVVSIVVPRSAEDEAWTAQRAQELFCSFVHFFTDPEAARQWFDERNMPVSFLSLDEAVKLGRIRFAAVIEQA